MAKHKEIRFRAWDIEGKGFINGFNMIGFSTGQGSPTPKLQRYDAEWDMDKVIITQYVGIKDEAGVEVYEGGIVEIQGCNYVVEWNGIELQWGLNITQGEYSPFDLGDYTAKPDGKTWFLVGKVVGNIHQNPELLKKNPR